MRYILLPGLDGTGFLFEPLLSHISNDFNISILPLKQEANTSYTEQAEYLVEKLGSEKIVLVAESYSGIIGYEVAKLIPENIVHLIFVASFLSRPSLFARFARLIPISIVRNGWVPSRVLGKLVFGKRSSKYLVSLFRRALSAVNTNVVRSRLEQVAKLTGCGVPLDVPCTYIRPINDYLVSKKAIDSIRKVCAQLVVKEVDGTHFVLQSNPRESWSVISEIAV